MNSKVAKEKGFVDTILDGKGAKSEFDLSMYANIPDEFKIDSNDTEPDKRTIEKALRDVGFSQNKAKAFIARGLKAKAEEEIIVPEPIIVPPQIIDNSDLIAAIKNNINLLTISGGN